MQVCEWVTSRQYEKPLGFSNASVIQWRGQNAQPTSPGCCVATINSMPVTSVISEEGDQLLVCRSRRVLGRIDQQVDGYLGEGKAVVIFLVRGFWRGPHFILRAALELGTLVNSAARYEAPELLAVDRASSTAFYRP